MDREQIELRELAHKGVFRSVYARNCTVRRIDAATACDFLAKYHLLVYPRLGYEVVIPEGLRDRVTLVDAPIIELSSTAVRERLAKGLSVRYYVPDEVLGYIERKGLYGLAIRD